MAEEILNIFFIVNAIGNHQIYQGKERVSKFDKKIEIKIDRQTKTHAYKKHENRNF